MIDYEKIKFKAGFVAIIGAPNVGKSTLLNCMLGEKISITSKKPQTTRNRILGVVHREKSQLVFIDTPGVHKTTSIFNERIVNEALAAIGDVDVILLVIDASKLDASSEELLIKQVKEQKKKVILALNKIDLIPKSDLLRIIERWSNMHAFGAIVPISALEKIQINDLLDAMERFLPEGPPLYPEESLTDLPERFICAEMIREKVFRLTGQEIPYATAVTIESFKEEKKQKLVKIHATIHVERDSQKGIIIGKKGSKLRQVGEASRGEIEKMVGTKVFLKLFVRVQKNWSRDTKALRKL